MIITDERIRDRINDFKFSAEFLLKDLEAYAIQKSSHQMQIPEKKTDLIDDVILLETELIAIVFKTKLKIEEIADIVKKFRDVWMVINGFSEEEKKEILKKTEIKLKDKVRETFCSGKEEK